MSRRRFIRKAAAFSAGAALAPLAARAKGRQPQKRPNLLFIFPDEMRRQAMGFLGQDPVITPNLDRFSRESLVLHNAVSNYPVCSPYRAMLLTGKYPFSNGVTTNCTPYPNSPELATDARCFSDVLHDAGYGLGYIGKWHLDAAKEPYLDMTLKFRWWDCFVPVERRHHFNFWHSYNCYDDHLDPHYYVGATIKERVDPKKWSPEHETDVAISYIENKNGGKRDPDKPFALFISHNPPHMPFPKVPQRYKDKYAGKTWRNLLNRENFNPDDSSGATKNAKKHVRNYFAQVTGVDDQFGRVLKCLKRTGLAANTIVVFTSDHGEMMGSQALMHKNQIYEESFLVPFLIRWPGRIRPGRDGLHLNVPDLMPSLLGLMGLADRIPKDVEGVDYSSILLGKGGKRPSSSFFIQGGRRRGVRTDRHTFEARRLKNRKLKFFLFDNREDPYQLRNIAGERPALVARLKGELNRWLKKTGDPWKKAVAGRPAI